VGILTVRYASRTIEYYTCLCDFSNSTCPSMVLVQISEVEAILTAFRVWLYNFCELTVIPKRLCGSVSSLQDGRMYFGSVVSKVSKQKTNRQPRFSIFHHPSHPTGRLRLVIKLNYRV
jgi:hypothetical protein